MLIEGVKVYSTKSLTSALCQGLLFRSSGEEHCVWSSEGAFDAQDLSEVLGVWRTGPVIKFGS